MKRKVIRKTLETNDLETNDLEDQSLPVNLVREDVYANLPLLFRGSLHLGGIVPASNQIRAGEGLRTD